MSPFFTALAYTALDEKEEAFKWLNKSKDSNERWFGWINVEPGFDSLRSDPRFTELVRFSGANTN